MSNYLNSYDKPLDLDFQRAIRLPDYYDTDLENFFTNPSKLIGIRAELKLDIKV